MLQSFASLGLHCLAAALASIIVEHIITISAPDPNHADANANANVNAPRNDDNDDAQHAHNAEHDIGERVPARYSFDRWRALEAYLREHVDAEAGAAVGLTLLVRLLAADSDWLVYQTLSSLWRAAYRYFLTALLSFSYPYTSVFRKREIARVLAMLALSLIYRFLHRLT